MGSILPKYFNFWQTWNGALVGHMLTSLGHCVPTAPFFIQFPSCLWLVGGKYSPPGRDSITYPRPQPQVNLQGENSKMVALHCVLRIQLFVLFDTFSESGLPL